MALVQYNPHGYCAVPDIEGVGRLELVLEEVGLPPPPLIIGPIQPVGESFFLSLHSTRRPDDLYDRFPLRDLDHSGHIYFRSA